MEFITTYQLPLIIGGLLIIMGFIGYEADKREKIKKGEIEPKKSRKRELEDVNEVEEKALVEEDTAPVFAPTTADDALNFQMDENVANVESGVAENAEPEFVNNVEKELVDNAELEFIGNVEDGMDGIVQDTEPLEMNNIEAVTPQTENLETYDDVVPALETEPFEKTVVAPVAEETEYPVTYDTDIFAHVTEEVTADNNQSLSTDESLKDFMEPVANVQRDDTFGLNDMSTFQVSQSSNVDASSGSIDAWKL